MGTPWGSGIDIRPGRGYIGRMDIDAPTDATSPADDLVTEPSTTDADVPADTDARALPDDEQDTDTPAEADDTEPTSPI